MRIDIACYSAVAVPAVRWINNLHWLRFMSRMLLTITASLLDATRYSKVAKVHKLEGSWLVLLVLWDVVGTPVVGTTAASGVSRPNTIPERDVG